MIDVCCGRMHGVPVPNVLTLTHEVKGNFNPLHLVTEGSIIMCCLISLPIDISMTDSIMTGSMCFAYS